MKSTAIVLLMVSITISNAQVHQTIPQIVHNRTDKDLELIEPDSADVIYINKRRTSSYFREAYTENVSLSSVSFLALNYRFYDVSSDKRKSCVIDATTNFYVPIIGNWGFIQKEGKKEIFMIGFYFIPAFDVRQFQNDPAVGDHSLAVRTPSLKAGGELIFTHSRIWNYEDNNSHRNRFACFVKFYHHSNGQDGPSINKVDMPYGKKGFINTYNGNFSDDFPLQVGGIFSSEQRKSSFFLKAGFEFSKYLKIGIDNTTDFYKLYPTERFIISGNWKFRPPYQFSIDTSKHIYKMQGDGPHRIMSNYNVEVLRIEYSLTIFTPSPKNWYYGNVYSTLGDDKYQQVDLFNKRRINVAVTVHCRIPGTRSSGFFIQLGYYGQDLYNIYFQRPNRFIRAGISFGTFTYPRKTDDIVKPRY
jgi:hypothetical protein